jgi:hypothetical protein
MIACCTRASVGAFLSNRISQQTWRLMFHMSGGFAGFDRGLDLTSDGDANAIDNRRKRQVAGSALPDELQTIDRLVTSAVAIDTRNPPQCRDCLTYIIELRTSQGQVTMRLGDDALAESTLTPLIRALTRLQDRLLSQP